jgi:hypothetical protein
MLVLSNHAVASPRRENLLQLGIRCVLDQPKAMFQHAIDNHKDVADVVSLVHDTVWTHIEKPSFRKDLAFELDALVDRIRIVETRNKRAIVAKR